MVQGELAFPFGFLVLLEFVKNLVADVLVVHGDFVNFWKEFAFEPLDSLFGEGKMGVNGCPVGDVIHPVVVVVAGCGGGTGFFAIGGFGGFRVIGFSVCDLGMFGGSGGMSGTMRIGHRLF